MVDRERFNGMRKRIKKNIADSRQMAIKNVDLKLT